MLSLALINPVNG